MKSLRNDVVPKVLPQVNGGEVVGVSGFSAGSLDFNEVMASHIWLVFAFVFSVAFLLLLVTFRSIVIPIKAILLNILSVAAAMGIVTYVFQDGHFEGLLNFDSTGAVSSWFPLMLFVILFGLSMDYHVFILSRIKEAVDRGESTEDAVSHGIKSTAGVVTAAAIVMVGVFGIFATLQFIDMKQFGVGLATAVLIDATLVRGVLLPATMKLLGKWNWYLPKWLEWMPKGPALEGSPEPHEPERTRRCGPTRGRPRRRPAEPRTPQPVHRSEPALVAGSGRSACAARRSGSSCGTSRGPTSRGSSRSLPPKPIVACRRAGAPRGTGDGDRRSRSRWRASSCARAGCAWRRARAASRRRCSPCARRRGGAAGPSTSTRAPWRLSFAVSALHRAQARARRRPSAGRR